MLYPFYLQQLLNAFTLMEFTQNLFTSRKPANPFVPVNQEQILSDLVESRQQISNGKGLDMEEALNQVGKQHGFI